MRSTARIIFLTMVALTTVLGTAQNTAATAHAERKVASRVAPNYPGLARKMHIHGVVKVEAIVRANGSVKSTRVLAETRCWWTRPSTRSTNGSSSRSKTKPRK